MKITPIKEIMITLGIITRTIISILIVAILILMTIVIIILTIRKGKTIKSQLTSLSKVTFSIVNKM